MESLNYRVLSVFLETPIWFSAVLSASGSRGLT